MVRSSKPALRTASKIRSAAERAAMNISRLLGSSRVIRNPLHIVL